MLSKEQLEKCKELYNNGMSITKISKTCKVNRGTLTKYLVKDGFQIRSCEEYSRKHELNEHYFDVIDTEEKAYILGFIYADGNNMTKVNRIAIKLNSKDVDILKKISQVLYGKELITFMNRKTAKGNIYEYCSLIIFSKHMSQQLYKLGVVDRKSKILTFPDFLPKELHKHFIRGMIDGDGWIYIPTNNRYCPNVGLISTRQINDTLREFFSSQLGLTSYLCKAHKQNVNEMCEIRVKNYRQSKILLDWLYKDAEIYLDRKHKIYQLLNNKYDNLREQNK